MTLTQLTRDNKTYITQIALIQQLRRKGKMATVISTAELLDIRQMEHTDEYIKYYLRCSCTVNHTCVPSANKRKFYNILRVRKNERSNSKRYPTLVTEMIITMKEHDVVVGELLTHELHTEYRDIAAEVNSTCVGYYVNIHVAPSLRSQLEEME